MSSKSRKNALKKVTPIKKRKSQRNLSVPGEPRTMFNLDHDHLRKQRIFVDDTDEESRVAIAAYKSLRTNVMRELEQRKLSTLMVTGVNENVGKTTTAVNLAISIAKHLDKHVVLVDFDLRRPSFAKLFNIPVDYGIDNIVDNDFQLIRAMQRPDLSRLLLLPCARAHFNSTEILMTVHMRHMVSLLRNYSENHIVIFDTPPILGCDDVPAITSIMDACLLVAGEGETSRDDFRQAVKALGDFPIIATVMNRSTEASFDKYYY